MARHFGPIARSTVRTSFVLGLRVVVQAGTLLLVARLLGPLQFGAFAGIAALALMLGTMSSFGLHLLLLRDVARDPAQRNDILRSALPFTLLSGCALLVVYLIAATLTLPISRVSNSVLLLIGLTELLLQPLLSFPVNEHLAHGRVERSQLLALFPLVLRLAGIATIAIFKPEDILTAYAGWYFAAPLLSLVIATVMMEDGWPLPHEWKLPTLAQLRDSAGYAVLAVTANGPTELDKTLAARLLPPAASGLYSAGARVIGATILPVMAMMLAATPRLFRHEATGKERIARLIRWLFAAAFCFGGLLAAALWIGASLLGSLFGPRYQGLGNMIHWLCFAAPALAIRIAAGSTLMALGQPWMRAGFELVGLGALTIASVVLTAKLGTNGMPLALAFSEWTMAAVGAVMVATLVKKTSCNAA